MTESPAIKRKSEVLELLDQSFDQRLVVHNDEVNTFDWVIQSLIEICRHDQLQAEQCAYIIHSRGRYAVMEGLQTKLNPMRRALVDRGINATLE